MDPAQYDHNMRRKFVNEMRCRFRSADAKADIDTQLDENACGISHLLLLCVHAHHRFCGPAAIPAVRKKFGNPPTTVVALPWCVRSTHPQWDLPEIVNVTCILCCSCNTFNPTKDIGREPDERYEDFAIFSEKREILVWRWASGREILDILAENCHDSSR